MTSMIAESSLFAWIAAIYVVVEWCFYVLFHNYIVPRANRLVEPAPYRDYGKERCKLMLRILGRIQETCEITNTDVKRTVYRFLGGWFYAPASQGGNNKKLERSTHSFPGLSASPSSSPDNSDDESDRSEVLPCFYKEDVADFFAWAFFGKHFVDLLPWETKELCQIFDILERTHDITFPSKPAKADSSPTFFQSRLPRLFSLEPVNAIHRPLLVYLIVYSLKFIAGLFLRSQGFRRHVSKDGLVAWYRPAKDPMNSLLPMLFFHGITPGGLVLYLPILLFGIATDEDRPVLLFENRSISCSVDFYPLSETQTVDGVLEILQKLQLEDSHLSLVGHSFGSCPITWLLASKRLKDVKLVVLLDPVTILLSEPDVMVNFFKDEQMDKIRMIASSELFTEYYLRRHFAWYNSELWLEDVQCPMLVCLAQEDEIINTQKVKQEIERHGRTVELVYWEGAKHGDCNTSPTKWGQIKELILRQELKIAQDER